MAEIGSAYLCGCVDIDKPVIENQSTYIDNWLQALKNKSDGGWIVKACSEAREAANYILSGGQAKAS